MDFKNVGSEYKLETPEKKYYLTVEENKTVSITEQDRTTKQVYSVVTSIDVDEFVKLMESAVSLIKSLKK